MVLDKQPDTMVQRIANKVYESCRAEQLKIVGFPSFAPLIQAIQQVKPDDQEKKYEVCVKKHDRLVVLQALAAKWMETEFKDETVAILEAHNKQFNVDGEYWHETERRACGLNSCLHVGRFHNRYPRTPQTPLKPVLRLR